MDDPTTKLWNKEQASIRETALQEEIESLRLKLDNSRADAEQVIKDTGCRSKLVDISPMVDPYISKYTGEDNLRRGNVFARMRMIVLYDHSSEEKALVVGTSNKTELLLGYSTLFGDSAYAIGPIGDLYKTQVRELSAHVGVAEQVISKPPSADLWMGQTDEEELGITYADADRILVQLVDNRVPPETLIERGEDEETVMTIIRRIRATQFKRTPPPIPKISSRSFGHDWLYARDWMT